MSDTAVDRQDAARAAALWETLAGSHALFSQALERELAAHLLTPPQYGVLSILTASGPLALSEIARQAGVTAANVTLVVENLVRAGWVERVRDGHDRRVTQARLTAAGTALMAEVQPAHERLVTQLSEGLTADEQEILMRLQKKLLGSLTRRAGI